MSLSSSARFLHPLAEPCCWRVFDCAHVWRLRCFFLRRSCLSSVFWAAELMTVIIDYDSRKMWTSSVNLWNACCLRASIHPHHKSYHLGNFMQTCLVKILHRHSILSCPLLILAPEADANHNDAYAVWDGVATENNYQQQMLIWCRQGPLGRKWCQIMHEWSDSRFCQCWR